MNGSEEQSGQRQKEGRYIIYQFPNWPIWVMLGAWIFDRLFTGHISSISSTIFYGAGVIWAYEEIANGVNLFRRILGIIVMFIMGFGMVNAMK